MGSRSTGETRPLCEEQKTSHVSKCVQLVDSEAVALIIKHSKLICRTGSLSPQNSPYRCVQLDSIRASCTKASVCPSLRLFLSRSVFHSWHSVLFPVHHYHEAYALEQKHIGEGLIQKGAMNRARTSACHNASALLVVCRMMVGANVEASEVPLSSELLEIPEPS